MSEEAEDLTLLRGVPFILWTWKGVGSLVDLPLSIS